MDDKMKAAFLAWHDSVTYIGPEDIVEWTLDYLRSQQEQAGEVHPDDAAVDEFAAAMKEKLAAARAKGRGGWNSDEPGMQQRLSDMLRAHVEKGDPRDVANFCMFLHQRGESILPQQPSAVDGACAVAAIQFALNDPEGMTFLRLWNEGEFETIRREWPEAPSSIYIGADPLAAQQQEPTT